jgi:hypothetical protein
MGVAIGARARLLLPAARPPISLEATRVTVEPAAGGIDGGRRVAAVAESGCHGGQLDGGGHRRSTCRLPEPERDRGALDAHCRRLRASCRRDRRSHLEKKC